MWYSRNKTYLHIIPVKLRNIWQNFKILKLRQSFMLAEHMSSTIVATSIPAASRIYMENYLREKFYSYWHIVIKENWLLPISHKTPKHKHLYLLMRSESQVLSFVVHLTLISSNDNSASLSIQLKVERNPLRILIHRQERQGSIWKPWTIMMMLMELVVEFS